ncbi:unnamed protein product [Microthlaspi erraticum]|uniref:F-box domain-containing protein n=1 Tax=Microthlaspi erraticum TaxID=1685480 RepID=A0A6D2HQG5_9BRAS|nr:unnamed protein product [Microthlaspi erraticum]
MGCISNLPDEIACHILSFLTTREAALSCVLSKRWRYLFAFTPNLRFEENDFVNGYSDVDIPSSFRDFLDRVLATSGNSPIKKFSLKYRDCVVSDHTNRWICNVLSRGALARLHLDVISRGVTSLSLEVFTCKTLVKLKLGRSFVINTIPENASLPALKTLFLDCIRISNPHRCPFEALLSAFPVLEELVMHNLDSVGRTHVNVSCRTLQRLTLHCLGFESFGGHISGTRTTISFDTPGLNYLDYFSCVPKEYPIVNLDSLVKAKLNLVSSPCLVYGSQENLFIGLRNVQILNLSTQKTMEGPLHYDDGYAHFSLYTRPLSCTVKVLEITLYDKTVSELEQLKDFLDIFSCLVLVKIRSWETDEKQKLQLTTKLLNLPRSSNCEFQFEFLRHSWSVGNRFV